MELRRETWTAAIRLAMIVSVLAALGAVVVSSAADVPQAAIVLTVIVVGFGVSWIRTNRVGREVHPSAAAPATERPQLV